MADDDHSCHGLIIHTFESKITNLEGTEAYETCRIMPSCQPDIYRRNFSAWCEECNAVFGNSFLAKQHRDTKKHKVKVSEYLVSEPAYFSYLISVLESDMEP